MDCRICGEVTREVFSHVVLNKYHSAYLYCDTCGFLQTQEPYWLDEAYSDAIADADTGLVQRNIALSRSIAPILYLLSGSQGRYLDLAGGYGMLTRMMRDIGFDFYWSDKYCANLLARGFAAQQRARFDVVTAFEVFEHLVDPVAFVSDGLNHSGARTMIFSTQLFAGEPPAPDSWWYYAFATGQHISFYQRRTLDVLAEKNGLRCYSNGSIHIFTDKTPNRWLKVIFNHSALLRLMSLVVRRRLVSKTMTDHQDMLVRKI